MILEKASPSTTTQAALFVISVEDSFTFCSLPFVEGGVQFHMLPILIILAETHPNSALLARWQQECLSWLTLAVVFTLEPGLSIL